MVERTGVNPNVVSDPRYQREAQEILDHDFGKVRDMLENMASLSNMSPLAFIRMIGELVYLSSDAGAKVELLKQSGMNELFQDKRDRYKFAGDFLDNLQAKPPQVKQYEGVYTIVGTDGEPAVPGNASGNPPEEFTFEVNGQDTVYFLVEDEDGNQFYIPKSGNGAVGADVDGDIMTVTVPREGLTLQESGMPIPAAFLEEPVPSGTPGSVAPIIPLTNAAGYFDLTQDNLSDWAKAMDVKRKENLRFLEDTFSSDIEILRIFVNEALTYAQGGQGFWTGSISNMQSLFSKMFS